MYIPLMCVRRMRRIVTHIKIFSHNIFFLFNEFQRYCYYSFVYYHRIYYQLLTLQLPPHNEFIHNYTHTHTHIYNFPTHTALSYVL